MCKTPTGEKLKTPSQPSQSQQQQTRTKRWTQTHTRTYKKRGKRKLSAGFSAYLLLRQQIVHRVADVPDQLGLGEQTGQFLRQQPDQQAVLRLGLGRVRRGVRAKVNRRKQGTQQMTVRFHTKVLHKLCAGTEPNRRQVTPNQNGKTRISSSGSSRRREKEKERKRKFFFSEILQQKARTVTAQDGSQTLRHKWPHAVRVGEASMVCGGSRRNGFLRFFPAPIVLASTLLSFTSDQTWPNELRVCCCCCCTAASAKLRMNARGASLFDSQQQQAAPASASPAKR